jgi:hypothetical protein
VWLDIIQIETFLDHMNWERETGEVKCSSTSMKEMDLLSPTHGLESLRENCSPGKHQEIEIDISLAVYL